MGCCESIPSRSYSTQTQHYQLQHRKDAERGAIIYVENLPRNTSASRIEKEFRKFGKIKSEKIRVRSEGSNACAFVEFETRASAAKAIQASPLVMCGRRVFVAQKRSSSCNSTCRDPFRDNAREERGAALYNHCITPCNSPNVDDCNTSCNSPNIDELEQCHEFSFPILT